MLRFGGVGSGGRETSGNAGSERERRERYANGIRLRQATRLSLLTSYGATGSIGLMGLMRPALHRRPTWIPGARRAPEAAPSTKRLPRATQSPITSHFSPISSHAQPSGILDSLLGQSSGEERGLPLRWCSQRSRRLAQRVHCRTFRRQSAQQNVSGWGHPK
jgi:hypothetical protein